MLLSNRTCMEKVIVELTLRLSGTHQLYFMKNGSFYDIDRGAEPDFVLTNPDKYYDRQALTKYINSLN